MRSSVSNRAKLVRLRPVMLSRSTPPVMDELSIMREQMNRRDPGEVLREAASTVIGRVANDNAVRNAVSTLLATDSALRIA